MKNEFMQLEIIDDRGIPADYLENAINNGYFCLGNAKSKIPSNLKSMYIYTMLNCLIDSCEGEKITVADLKKLIIDTSSKKDGKRFGTDAIIISSIKELIKCGVITKEDKFLYVH